MKYFFLYGLKHQDISPLLAELPAGVEVYQMTRSRPWFQAWGTFPRSQHAALADIAQKYHLALDVSEQFLRY